MEVPQPAPRAPGSAPRAPRCEHGPGYHDGGVPSRASAPEKSRAWLLIEHDGPWAAEAVATPLPGELGKLAVAADELGIRVQLIRRPAREDRAGAARVFAAWTADPRPWLVEVTGDEPDLEALAAGERPAGGTGVDRMYLVCTHGRRDRCCARLGGPLARALAPDYRDELWETTHVGGHKFAANLVLLPHGRYYGPCDLEVARAAIGACERGATEPRRYRGRAGQPAADQEAEHAALTHSEQLRLFLCKALGRVSRRTSSSRTRPPPTPTVTTRTSPSTCGRSWPTRATARSRPSTREYVQAAKTMGSGQWRILRRHLVPNAVGVILVITLIAFNLIGEAARDALDVRLR